MRNIKEFIKLAETNARDNGAKVLSPEWLLLEMFKDEDFQKAMFNIYGEEEGQKKIDLYTEYLEDNYFVKVKDKTKTSRSIPQNELFRSFISFAYADAHYEGLDEIYPHNCIEALQHIPNSIVFKRAFGAATIDTEKLYKELKSMMKTTSKSSRSRVASGSSVIEGTEVEDILTDMSVEESKYKFPFVGREDIITRVEQVLSRMTKNNVILVGKPGVGKTAVTIGFQRKINEGNVPEKLKSCKVFELGIGSLMAGTQYRGQLEERLKNCLTWIEENVENPILYIDEIHTITGSGASSGSALDIANILKPYLTKGTIKFIGSTTEEEYKKFIEPDKALVRRFQQVVVNEPTRDEAIKMIEGIQKSFEDFHNVKFTKAAIKASVDLSVKYMHERYLPDKAIDLMDETGAKMALAGVKKITEKEIQTTLATICSIPAEHVDDDETASLKKLYSNLTSNVYGQDEAAKALNDSILMSRAGLTQDNKPQGCYLLVGPTGVGKTEVAKTLSKTLGIPLIRFDMSEYMEAHSVSKLIGAPAGYVGYGDGGQLVEAVRKSPNCVLLFDEMEKAHPAVFNILLQVMDNAELTDSQGRKADFRQTIILMTSNCGASEVGKAQIGFSRDAINMSAITENVNKTFSPEFRNRLTKIITFNPLNEDMALQIAGKALRQFAETLKKKKVNLSWSDDVVSKVAKDGITPEFGGREVVRVVDRDIKPLFVEELLFGSLKNGGTVKIELDENNCYILKTIAVSTKKKPALV